MFNKSCQWLDLNPGAVVVEATALSTVPQPLPFKQNKFLDTQILWMNGDSRICKICWVWFTQCGLTELANVFIWT